MDLFLPVPSLPSQDREEEFADTTNEGSHDDDEESVSSEHSTVRQRVPVFCPPPTEIEVLIDQVCRWALLSVEKVEALPPY